MANKFIVLCIEGNIGSGKTSCIEKIKSKMQKKYNLSSDNILVIDESVKMWESSFGHNNLNTYYKGEITKAFFQVLALGKVEL